MSSPLASDGSILKVWNFYNGLLGTTGQRDLTLDLEVFHRPNADLADLEQFFSEDEI
jgi:hypothetical protein